MAWRTVYRATISISLELTGTVSFSKTFEESVPYGYSKSGVKGFRMKLTVQATLRGRGRTLEFEGSSTINEIELKWKNGRWYTYRANDYGQEVMAKMFQFARTGRGLTRFANTLKAFGR